MMPAASRILVGRREPGICVTALPLSRGETEQPANRAYPSAERAFYAPGGRAASNARKPGGERAARGSVERQPDDRPHRCRRVPLPPVHDFEPGALVHRERPLVDLAGVDPLAGRDL